MNTKSVLEDKQIVDQALAVIENAVTPVSVDYIAHNLNLSWATARALLFQLALEGKLASRRTTSGWIFEPVNTKSAEAPRGV